MSTPLVSVWLITYNHERYIAQAIEGVLMQKTSFAVHLVIGEDCSTDNTRAIVKEYKALYPDRITLYLPERNMGMLPILRPTFALCQSKYVAMLDGDDYWTDPLKLQKQVDALEADPELMLAYHQVQVSDEINGTTYLAAQPKHPLRVLTLEDFIQPSHPVITLSTMFRNVFNGVMPELYYELPYPDLALFILLLKEGGKAVYNPDNMGVYRIHAKGAFSGLDKYARLEQRITFFTKLKPELSKLHQCRVAEIIGFHYYELMMTALREGSVVQAAQYFKLMSGYSSGLIKNSRTVWHALFTTMVRNLSTFYRKTARA
ncbi:glycosyltransferase [Hymenobacter oligotrophus]|uniref:Glycosyltransferase n=1 Tax=Hymenobacter oligotrophus TaxID=2319843 RepID=A0A3B7QZ30_9BACT|nr:glycosyltransferase [Hymenobacter oligotrophus]AYA37124.1 glycosyltransferase [Hymenobacter oligotrophus]